MRSLKCGPSVRGLRSWQRLNFQFWENWFVHGFNHFVSIVKVTINKPPLASLSQSPRPAAHPYPSSPTSRLPSIPTNRSPSGVLSANKRPGVQFDSWRRCRKLEGGWSEAGWCEAGTNLEGSSRNQASPPTLETIERGTAGGQQCKCLCEKEQAKLLLQTLVANNGLYSFLQIKSECGFQGGKHRRCFWC